MEDFFKQFRDDLEQRPEPPFVEKDWLELEKRLYGKGDKRSLGFAWAWVVLPLLLLSLLTNTFFFIEWKKADRRLQAVQVQKDTVRYSKVIYKTDTIFQTRIIRETITEGSANGWTSNEETTNPEYLENGLSFRGWALNRTNAQPAPYWQNQRKPIQILSSEYRYPGTGLFLPKDPSMPFLQPGGNPLILREDTDNKEPFRQEDLRSAARQLPALPLQYLPEQPPAAHPMHSLPVQLEKRKKLLHHLYAMRPKGFSLSVNGGLAYPVADDLSRVSGITSSFLANIEFSAALRLWTGIDYSRLSFVSTKMDESLGIPLVEAPSDDFSFTLAEVKQPAFQYAAGLQYLFNADGKWKPFIGAGLGAILLQPYTITYEFRNEMLNAESEIEEEIRPDQNPINFALTRAGIERALSKRWNIRLDAAYRINLDKSRIQSPKTISLQMGLLYKL